MYAKRQEEGSRLVYSTAFPAKHMQKYFSYEADIVRKMTASPPPIPPPWSHEHPPTQFRRDINSTIPGIVYASET